MTHKVLVEVHEGQQVSHLSWIEEPFVFAEDHVRDRVRDMLLEDPVACILLRVGDVRWVDDDGVDEGNRGESLILDRAVPRSIVEDKPCIHACSCLSVDMASEAIDHLLGTAIDGEDELVEEFVGLHEAYVL